MSGAAREERQVSLILRNMVEERQSVIDQMKRQQYLDQGVCQVARKETIEHFERMLTNRGQIITHLPDQLMKVREENYVLYEHRQITKRTEQA